MIFALEFARHALEEIETTYEWLARTSRPAAQRWHDRLFKSIKSLQQNPARCALAPESEWFSGEIRQLISGKRLQQYRILFQIQHGTVYVLRVRHGAQALLEPGEL
jgi:plasmid stabilization system protein ParE